MRMQERTMQEIRTNTSLVGPHAGMFDAWFALYERYAAERGARPDRRIGGMLWRWLLDGTYRVAGVIEAEGASGAATALAIAVRSAAASPVAKTLIAAAAGAMGSYARSLVHDAAAGQPALRPIADFGRALDACVHRSLGIPQSDAR